MGFTWSTLSSWKLRTRLWTKRSRNAMRNSTSSRKRSRPPWLSYLTPGRSTSTSWPRTNCVKRNSVVWIRSWRRLRRSWERWRRIERSRRSSSRSWSSRRVLWARTRWRSTTRTEVSSFSGLRGRSRSSMRDMPTSTARLSRPGRSRLGAMLREFELVVI